MATSLLTGKPAPSPLFSTGPSDGFSCHVKPSKLIAAHKETEREGESRRERMTKRVDSPHFQHDKDTLRANPLSLICHLYGN